MIAYTLVKIALVKINQRFSDATTRTGKTRKHFNWAKRLISFQMVVAILQQ